MPSPQYLLVTLHPKSQIDERVSAGIPKRYLVEVPEEALNKVNSAPGENANAKQLALHVAVEAHESRFPDDTDIRYDIEVESTAQPGYDQLRKVASVIMGCSVWPVE